MTINTPINANAMPSRAADRGLAHHYEFEAQVSTDAPNLFAHLDDHRRVAGHMSKRSWMMAGSSMTVEVDERRGAAVGSHIRLLGSVLGIRLFVDEVVTHYRAGEAKTWETVGAPRLLVIGPYQMGFAIKAHGSGSLLRVFIDYGAPAGRLGRLASALFGHLYAKWCVKKMVLDAAAAFSPQRAI